MTKYDRVAMTVLAAIMLAFTAVCITHAQDKPATEPPTIESLQKQVAEKDAQIAGLTKQVNDINGRLTALSRLHGACFEMLAQDEAQLPKK